MAGWTRWLAQDNGQVHTILQPHTPANNPGFRPTDLLAIYSRKNTSASNRAKPWMAPNGTSYVCFKDDCAVSAGHVWRCAMDDIWLSTTYLAVWEDLGAAEEICA